MVEHSLSLRPIDENDYGIGARAQRLSKVERKSERSQRRTVEGRDRGRAGTVSAGA
jgi:hypothetical protein